MQLRIRSAQIDHQRSSARGREGEAHQSTSFRRHKIDRAAIAQEIQMEMIGRYLHLLRSIGGSPSRRIRRRVSHHREKGCAAIVGNPGTQLMGRPNPFNPPVCRTKEPRRAGAFGLQAPVSHSERQSNQRKRIAARKQRTGIGPLQGIHKIHKAARAPCGCAPYSITALGAIYCSSCRFRGCLSTHCGGCNTNGCNLNKLAAIRIPHRAGHIPAPPCFVLFSSILRPGGELRIRSG